MQAVSDILSAKHPADVISFIGILLRVTVTTTALDMKEKRHLHGVWRVLLTPRRQEKQFDIASVRRKPEFVA
jgi:hypothetical protein